ncbi:hypothetical protein [Marinifilum fragile]|uniref:hypothetical protein n=1 Tax=Marinifilum fragile TaxID=570161 RepID=UPI0006D01DCF|nr:hypothetical protein [Marinifilum fragile]
MKYLFSILTALLFSSCASSYLSSEKLTDPKKMYQKIFVVNIFDNVEFRQLNEKNYNSAILNRFNEMNSLSVRRLMKGNIQNNFDNNRIQLVFASDEFKINQEVDYQNFIAKVEANSDAILLINQAAFYYEKEIKSDSDGNIKTNTTPAGTFLTYLIDTKTKELIWVGRFDSSGTVWDDKFSLYNNMSRKLHKQLIKEHLIPKPFQIKQ